ncbi:exo-beta-N-acetylmuramidase NamZ domain-containing protein [Luteolibacter marinus]|uniref:exo-beta-N-acetylmuramidase NamZ domain-containing protein n=1 Tax=Luteolibacter marinus TaxID=2776705 RepID=UPI001867933D|nr:exo-beta-N-acetylmuramidase NamZ domain-containing protein [Luteolibacter marinus]
MIHRLLALLLATLLTVPASATAIFKAEGLAAIDDAILQAVTDARTPGGVFLMERNGTTYLKAYGDRAILPAREPMTEDTIFDAASLTKVIATTPAVMKLAEAGKLDVEQPLSRYLPEFKGHGKEAITVRQLLTHSSGLRAGLPLNGVWQGKDGALATACAEPLPAAPGTSYRYSDINFILLGLLVERVAGEALDVFCQREIYKPLAMDDTGFRDLSGRNAARIAPTTLNPDGSDLRGIVHDPTARRMGGVAGHAGLFLTARDLGRFARMMLGGGELDGSRVFKQDTIAAMTSVQSPPGLPLRGFGWDIDSPFAGPRGAIFPVGSYGHTGWTGTRLWIDPQSQTSVIFLSNRNHPDEGGNVIGLQRELGTLAALAIDGFTFATAPPSARKPATGPVLNGIDVLKRDGFRQLRGRRVGLITNHSGIDRERNATIDLLKDAPGVTLVALFSPEHGIRGDQDHAEIGDSVDRSSGLPVHSLYGERRTPNADQLAGIDTLVFDIQDIGCRFYTYIATLTNCLEAAGKAKLRFVVLDRVNPIGPRVEGPVLTGKRSFVAPHEIPVRHGMTVGELARLINAERKFGTDLGVIRCEGGSPLQWFDATGLPWRDPSPNMRGPTAATLYPGVGLLEFCKVSVGRGTGTPFELLGAPYIDDLKFAAEMNRAGLPGVRFVPVRFTPDASVFAGQECRGVRILLTDRDSFSAADLGATLAATLQRLHGKQLELGNMSRLLGDGDTLEAIRSRAPLERIRTVRDRGLNDFSRRRGTYLLYPR